ncbi:hypothetical protein F8388_017326 [Cannabis sativa]|uniref:Uncharacterized protein n=1 Tax=Cannabis sativa TaxID=3483 RepID=A0A7J6FZE9_CANSA|nr:hypothetical protein F8388_017326 [Cannabis sativa]
MSPLSSNTTADEATTILKCSLGTRLSPGLPFQGFWIPVSELNFWVVPLQARIAFMSMGSIFWNFCLSSTMNKHNFGLKKGFEFSVTFAYGLHLKYWKDSTTLFLEVSFGIVLLHSTFVFLVCIEFIDNIIQARIM